MSSHDDTKPRGLDAKTAGEMAQEFTADNRLGQAIANASPETQARLREHLATSEQAYESQARWQQETKSERVLKERNRLLERYMNDPTPRPNSLEARQNDMRIIDERADRNVAQRDQHQLNSFKNVVKSQTYQMLKNDRQQQAQHGVSTQVNDPEHDRG